MMKETISIIIPTYNSSNTIERCLSSVLNQGSRQIEAVIVDDGSTDDTVVKIRRMNDPRIKIFTREHNGVSAARNLGIRVCSGQLILFLDSDDELEYGAIERLLNIRKSSNKSDIIGFNYYEVRNGKKSWKHNSISSNTIDAYNNEEKSNVIDFYFSSKSNAQCYLYLFMFDKNYLVKNNLFFDESLCMMEDATLLLKIIKKGAYMTFIDEPLMNHYINNDSITHSRIIKKETVISVINSSYIITNELNNRQDIIDRYSKLIMGYALKYAYKSMKKANEMLSNEKLQSVIYKSSLKKNGILWTICRNIFLNKRVKMMYILSFIFTLKSRIASAI